MKIATGYTESTVVVRQPVYADVVGYKPRKGWERRPCLAEMTAAQKAKELDAHLRRWKDHAGLSMEEIEA